MYQDVQATCTQDAAKALGLTQVTEQASSLDLSRDPNQSKRPTSSDGMKPSAHASWIPNAQNIIRCADTMEDSCFAYINWANNTFKVSAHALVQKLVSAGLCTQSGHDSYIDQISTSTKLTDEDGCKPVKSGPGDWLIISTSDRDILRRTNWRWNTTSTDIAAGDGWVATSQVQSASLMMKVAALLSGKYASVVP
jgi:hypothetical protein